MEEEKEHPARYPPAPSVVTVSDSESCPETIIEKEDFDSTSTVEIAATDNTSNDSLPPSPHVHVHAPVPRRDSNPWTWDPLAKISPKLDPHKPPEKLSMCPHCRRVETGLTRLPPLEDLPPSNYYRFRDEESRLPPLETLPPTRRYRFDDIANQGTARVYPDPPEIKCELDHPPFLCLLPLILMNLAYLSWLIADLCYSYGPYTRFKPYFTSSGVELNRGMEIFAGVFLFLTNMAFLCKIVFRGPNYNGPSISQASRGDKKWVARAAIFGCLPVIMLIIMAAIRKNMQVVLLTDKPVPTCENLGYPTRLQFEVLDHATVRSNQTGLYNNVTISSNSTSATLQFETIYDPEALQNTFVLSNTKGDIHDVLIDYFLTSRQYTVKSHSTNETDNPLPEYAGGSWQEAPGLGFQNLVPQMQSKKVNKWQIKAFSDGSFLELFPSGPGVDEKKAWLRTLDRRDTKRNTYMEACTMGGVEDVSTLVPAGVLLIEFAKNVYDTTN
ncbi:hypothetical protein Dda_7639 [Drechslerella dactyloides]|uniref:Uncharacterized protein n=1 Tax=Drechslerella dactyloides TaxID=74499 RepID=A0AAD6IUF4_DREDA|nr:hypothetical protein Dda_7639 [Drechslerella dactyloides]